MESASLSRLSSENVGGSKDKARLNTSQKGDGLGQVAGSLLLAQGSELKPATCSAGTKMARALQLAGKGHSLHVTLATARALRPLK